MFNTTSERTALWLMRTIGAISLAWMVWYAAGTLAALPRYFGSATLWLEIGAELPIWLSCGVAGIALMAGRPSGFGPLYLAAGLMLVGGLPAFVPPLQEVLGPPRLGRQECGCLLAFIILVGFAHWLTVRLLPTEPAGPGRARTFFFSALTLCALFLILGAQPGSTPRTEGEWKVTPVGRLQFTFFSPERNRLIVGCKDKSPELWDTLKGERVAILREQLTSPHAAAWSPDNDRFVTAEEIGYFNAVKEKKIVRSIWIWATATGRLLQKIEIDLSAEGVRDSTDWQVDWLARDTLLLQLFCRWNPARASVGTVFGLVDVPSGRMAKMTDRLEVHEQLSLSPDRKRGFTTAYFGAYRTPDGGIGQGGLGATGRVDLVDLVNLKLIATLGGPEPGQAQKGPVVRAVWSEDGHRIATVGSDHSVCVWDGFSGKLAATLKGHKEWVLGVSFSPDNRRVVTASDDDTARVWDAETGDMTATLNGHLAGLNDAAFDPTGQFVLTAGEDETARLWDAKTGKQLRAFSGHEGSVRHVRFIAGGKQAHSVTLRGVERTWSVADGSLVTEKKPERNVRDRFGNCFLRENKERVTEVWVGPAGVVPPAEPDDRFRLVIGETTVRDDDPEARLALPRQKLWGHRPWVTALALAADGITLASASQDQTVMLWDLSRWDPVTGKGRSTLEQPCEVWSIAMTPDGKSVAAGCEGGSVIVWDAVATKKRIVVDAHQGRVQSLAISPDGKTLASVGMNAVKLWDLSTGNERVKITDQLGTTNALAFSPDGKVLFTGGTIKDWKSAGAIQLLDTTTGEPRQRLLGPAAAVTSMAITPDGRWLATGGFDGAVKLWDLTGLKERADFKGHKKVIVSVAISRDGKVVASGDRDGFIQLWDTETAKERTSFRAHTFWVTALAFTPSGDKLISSSSSPPIKVWDLANFTGAK
jgi:WD40 repeat protein